jgi:hypothetical protein
MHPEYKTLTNNYYPILSALVVRDGYGCVWCGSTKYLRVDHILPVKQGGITDLENLQILCNRCNGIKGNTIADYRPANRGNLGKAQTQRTTDGALLIRVWHWYPDNSRWGAAYRYLDCEVVRFRARDRVYVLFTDGRSLNAHLRDVYPPDLQHLYQ